MPSQISGLDPERQVDLDRVAPGLREQFCTEPVYVERELYDRLRNLYGSRFDSELASIVQYFLGEGGPAMWLEGEGEKLELYLDSYADENEKKYYMILNREPRE